MIISRSFLPRNINISDKSCTENQNTHFVVSNFFFENRADCEIMWENILERGRPQMAIWRMRTACWIRNATNTHTDTACVIFIAFPQQRWQHDRAAMLHYTLRVLFKFVSY